MGLDSVLNSYVRDKFIRVTKLNMGLWACNVYWIPTYMINLSGHQICVSVCL